MCMGMRICSVIRVGVEWASLIKPHISRAQAFETLGYDDLEYLAGLGAEERLGLALSEVWRDDMQHMTPKPPLNNPSSARYYECAFTFK